MVFRSPILRMRSYVLHMFTFFQLTFSDIRQPTFSKLFHMTWLQSHRKCCYVDFLKVLHNKNGEKPQILPIFASNHIMLNVVTRDVEGK